MNLTTGLVQPRASIDGADEPPFGAFCCIKLGSVHLAHHAEQPAGLGRRVPFHVGGVVFDKIGEGRVSPRWLGKRPPKPVFPHFRRHVVERRPQCSRVPKRRRRGLRQRSWNFQIATDADHEQSRARLRNEQRRVDHDRAKDIARSLEGRTDRSKILALMRGQRAADILESNDARRLSFGDQALHQAPEWPKRAGAVAFQAGASAGKRKVLAGERRPCEIDGSRHLLGRKRANVGRLENSIAPVEAIDGALFVIEVVGEAATPLGAAKAGANHPAAGEEFEKVKHDPPSFPARCVIVLLAGELLGNRFGDPGVAENAAGAPQARRVDRRPNLGIEAKALAAPVVHFCVRVSRGHVHESGAGIKNKRKTEINARRKAEKT